MSENQFVPLQDLIRSVSTHLDGLAAEVNAIEHAVGEKLGQDDLVENTYIQRLQRLDYLRQSLEDLALLNLFIADRCRGEISESTGQRLRLETTKALLGQHKVVAPSVTAEQYIGDVDLF